MTSIVDGHEHAFAHIGAEIDERVVIDVERQIVAKLEGDVFTTLLGETTNLVEVVLLEVIVAAETHEATIVGVIASLLSELVALIDTGNARQREVQFLEQQCLGISSHGITDAYVTRPTGCLAIFVPADGSTSKTDETCLVVIA